MIYCKYLLVSIILVAPFVFGSTQANRECKDLSRIIRAIYKSVLLYEKYYDEFNLDGWFGFLETERSMNRTKLNKISKICGPKYSQKIEKMKTALRYLNSKTETLLKQSHPTYYNAISEFIKQILKVDNPTITLNKMDPDYAKLPPRRGMYNENRGDKCYTKLTNSCKISKDCAEMFIPNQKLKGYGATHAILYLGIYKHKKCYLKEGNNSLTETKMTQRINNLCASVYGEVTSYMKALMTKKVPRDVNLDLFLEEVYLCGGMIGYKDFMNHKVLETILISQNSGGCFSFYHYASVDDRKGLRRTKRRSVNLGGSKCSDHTLGLGVSALSTFLVRFI